jgi:MoxR-like ATPase
VLRDLGERMAAEIRKVVVGQDDAVELLLAASTVGGHILIEGVPGVAKTLLANALARTMAVKFQRVQFTPDTTPTDITGGIGPGQLGMTFHKGPIFTNVLLADEINRTPPAVQAALLEAMQERQVTVASETHRLPDPFIVIATQNPIVQQGTWPLPEAQLDRFLFKIDMGYPSEEDERSILELTHRGLEPASLLSVNSVVIGTDLVEARGVVDSAAVSPEVIAYITSIIRKTRELPAVSLGASPRAAVHLMAAAKAKARIAGRDMVEPEDVTSMALPVLKHRLALSPEALGDGYSPDDILWELLASTPVPGRV